MGAARSAANRAASVPPRECADHGRGLRAGLVNQRLEPLGEAGGVEPVQRLRLAEARKVGHDHAVPLGQLREHRRPDHATALDAAVHEDQRRALAPFEHGGGGAGEP